MPAGALALLAGLLFSAGFLAGKFSSARRADQTRPPAAEPTAAEPQLAVPRVERKARAIERPFLVRPLHVFDAEDKQAERAYHAQQSRELIGMVRTRLALQRGVFPDDTGESVVTPLLEYLGGLMDGLIRTAPDLADELAVEIENTLCRPDAKEEEMIMLARMIHLAPELSTDRSFDCIFASPLASGQENAVVWYGIDAWKASGLPKTEAIANIERSATDQRTIDRFAPPPPPPSIEAVRAATESAPPIYARGPEAPPGDSPTTSSH